MLDATWKTYLIVRMPCPIYHSSTVTVTAVYRPEMNKISELIYSGLVFEVQHKANDGPCTSHTTRCWLGRRYGHARQWPKTYVDVIPKFCLPCVCTGWKFCSPIASFLEICLCWILCMTCFQHILSVANYTHAIPLLHLSRSNWFLFPNAPALLLVITVMYFSTFQTLVRSWPLAFQTGWITSYNC